MPHKLYVPTAYFSSAQNPEEFISFAHLSREWRIFLRNRHNLQQNTLTNIQMEKREVVFVANKEQKTILDVQIKCNPAIFAPE